MADRSDTTAERIAAALERIATALERHSVAAGSNPHTIYVGNWRPSDPDRQQWFGGSGGGGPGGVGPAPIRNEKP